MVTLVVSVVNSITKSSGITVPPAVTVPVLPIRCHPNDVLTATNTKSAMASTMAKM